MLLGYTEQERLPFELFFSEDLKRVGHDFKYNINESKIDLNPLDVEHMQASLDAMKNDKFMRFVRPFANMVSGIPFLRSLMSTEDVHLKKILEEVISGVNFNVYSIPNSTPNAFTLPNAPRMMSKNPQLLSIGDFLGIPIWQVATGLESLYTVCTSKLKPEVNISESGIEIKNTDNITLYYTSRLTDILNAREIIAVSMHEIGHNLIRVQDFLVRLSALLMLGITVAFLTIPVFFIVSAMISYFMIMLGIRSLEDSSDRFAGKAGFGTEFTSAIDKTNKFINSGAIFSNSGWNIFEQILNVIFWIAWQIYRLTSPLKLATYSSPSDRMKNASDAQNAQWGPTSEGILVRQRSMSITETEMLMENAAVDALLDKLAVVTEKLAKFIMPAFK